MSWPTDLSNPVNYSHAMFANLALANAFQGKIDARKTSQTGTVYNSTIVQGDSVFSFWKNIQTAIVSMLSESPSYHPFLLTHDTNGNSINYDSLYLDYATYTNPFTSDYIITISKLMQSISSGAATHFRRVPKGVAYPTDWTDYNDPSYSFGLAQGGDIVGPWIIWDLYHCLINMRLLLFSAEYQASGSNWPYSAGGDNITMTSTIQWKRGNGYDSDITTAKSLAESNFSDRNNINDTSAMGPGRQSTIQRGYDTELVAQACTWTISSKTNEAGDIKIIAPAIDTTWEINVFSDCGDTFDNTIQANKWCMVTHLDNYTSSNNVTPEIGNIAMPPWCATPSGYDKSWRGYQIYFPLGILDLGA